MCKDEIVSELEKISGKEADLSVEGSINSRITFNKLKFEFIYDTLKLYDDSDNIDNYFIFNLNQIIKFYSNRIVRLVTDSDMIISIKEKTHIN